MDKKFTYGTTSIKHSWISIRRFVSTLEKAACSVVPHDAITEDCTPPGNEHFTIHVLPEMNDDDDGDDGADDVGAVLLGSKGLDMLVSALMTGIWVCCETCVSKDEDREEDEEADNAILGALVDSNS